MRILILALLCALTGLAACSGPAQTTTAPHVVVSIRPLQLLVQDLAGPEVNVTPLMPPSADPHHFALSTEARQAVAAADLVVWLGPELERPLARLLAGDPRAVGLAPAGEDVHVWLDPAFAASMVDTLTQALSKLRPDPELSARASALKAKLASFREHASEALAPARERVYGVEHPAFDRFAASVGLPPALAVNPHADANLSAGRVAELQGALSGGACFMAETANREAVRLAELFKLPLVVVDPLARDPAIDTYLGFLERVRAGFYECFGIEAG